MWAISDCCDINASGDPTLEKERAVLDFKKINAISQAHMKF